LWLGKFLDLKDDIDSMASEIKKEILTNLKKSKLTPLEFTILETIFNSKELSGYDLIAHLDNHFAGIWIAQSGTIYPILSKLKKTGFLLSKPVKSELGPLKKVYYLSESGERILKLKVNKNFGDQINFIENFLIDLASLFIHSSEKELKEEDLTKKIDEVLESLKKSFSNITTGISSKFMIIQTCPKCNAESIRKDAAFCAVCGTSLSLKTSDH